MAGMKLVATPLLGLFEAKSSAFADHRGEFARLFCADDLAEAHAGRPIVQINRSITNRVGAVRGLHYQDPPHAEAKWVRCVRGKVWDVAVDLRRGSSTFLRWHAVELDALRMNAYFLPEGFAHGFQVLVPDSELLYFHTARYTPAAERGIRYDDRRVKVDWPLPVIDLSERDMKHPLLEDNFEGLLC